MSMTNKLPLLGLLAVLAACGGDKPAANTPAADTTTAAAAPAVAPAAAPAPAAPATGNVIEVHMVTSANGASGTFEPANVTAKKGDTVRFITDGKTVHNVSFPAAENVGKAGLPTTPGAYLTTPNQSIDLVVGMEPGTYNFQCDPHATMGMKGTLTVQ
jgi:plastocyanin